MSAVLIAHGIAYGGSFSDPDPTITSVTLNTVGATFIFVSYAADVLQGDLPPFADSAGNTWQHLTQTSGRPYFPFTSGTASFYWVASPATSTTHTFTATVGGGPSAAGHGYAVMHVMAWGGMSAPAFGSPVWISTGLSTLSVGPVSVAAGIGFAIGSAGKDPTTAGAVELTTAGWTVIDSLPATRFVTDFGHCGMTVGYKTFGAVTPGVTNDWLNHGVDNYFGAGMFPVTFTPLAPPVVYVSPLYVTDQTSAFDDGGEAFQAYVLSPALPPSGRIDIQGALRESHLVARAAANVSVQMTLLTDFGLALPIDSVALDPVGTETRVTRKFENMRNADLVFCQVQLGDAAPVANYWSLEAFAGIAQVEGEK